MRPDPQETAEEHAELARRAARGDRKALQDLLDALSPWVFRLAARILADAHEAQDAAQETLMKLVRSIATLREPRAVRGWVRTTLLHQIRDGWRRKGVRPEVVSLDAGDVAQRLAGSAPPPHEHIVARELDEIIERALTDLPPIQRGALQLVIREGMSYAGIAEALGATEASVKASVSLARARLRETIARHEGEA